MSTKKSSTAVTAALAAAGALVVGGAALANAATTPAPTPSSSYSATAGTPGQQGDQQGGRGGHGGRGMHEHTAASAEETAKVKAAVTAKDSSVTVSEVRKDADGSFDAMGTKDGQRVMVEVSKDLATVEVRTGGPGGRDGGHGGRGMHEHTAASAEETAKVKAAVTAKDSSVTVSEVRKDADGSFDAMGTKDGQRVMVEVSKDLATVEVRTGGPGGPGGRDGGRGPEAGGQGQSGPSTQPGQAPTTTQTSTQV